MKLTVKQEYHAKYIRKHYAENKDYYKAHARKSNAKFKEWYRSLKDNKSCSVCRQLFPYYILDWHHVGKKTMGLPILANKTYSRKRVLKELENCILVCANCHRELTYGKT